MDEDWTKNHKKEGSAKGGPYLAVHLRRADFLYAHPDGVPSLDNAIKQIKEILDKQKLDMVFLATDADKEGEMQKLFKNIILLPFQGCCYVFKLLGKQPTSCDATTGCLVK